MDSQPSNYNSNPSEPPRGCFPFFSLPGELRELILVFALQTVSPFGDGFVQWWKRYILKIEGIWTHTGGVDLGFTSPPTDAGLASGRRYFVLPPTGKTSHCILPYGEGWTYGLPQAYTGWMAGTEVVRHAWTNSGVEPRLEASCQELSRTPSPEETTVESDPSFLDLHLSHRLTPTNLYLVSKQVHREARCAFWNTNTLMLNLVDKDICKRWTSPSAVPLSARLSIRSISLVFRRMNKDIDAIVDELSTLVLQGSLRDLSLRFEDSRGVAWKPPPGHLVPIQGEVLQHEGTQGIPKRELFPVTRCDVMRKLAKTLADPDLRERSVWVGRRHRGGWCGLHDPLTPKIGKTGSAGGKGEGDSGPKCKMIANRCSLKHALVAMDAGEDRAWIPVDWKRFVQEFGKPEECEIFKVREGWKG